MPRPKSGEIKIKTAVMIPLEVSEKIKAYAMISHQDLGKVVTDALRKYIIEHNSEFDDALILYRNVLGFRDAKRIE